MNESSGGSRLLTVAAATGPTGRLVVEQALDRGHRVLALARRVEALPDRDGVTRAAWSVGQAVPDLSGVDAVVSALGVRERRPTTTYSVGVADLVGAMKAAGVHRFVGISAAGVVPPSGPLVQRLALAAVGRIYRHAYDDMRRMEDVLARSGLGWTVVRPPRLTDRAPTGYRQAEGVVLGTLGRRDLAALLVELATSPAAPSGITYAVSLPGRAIREHVAEE